MNLKTFTDFKDFLNGNISLQMSSTAEKKCAWLKVGKEVTLIDVKNAKKLIKALQEFIEHD